MQIAGKILNNIFVELSRFVRPGLKKAEIEKKLIKLLNKYGVKSATKDLNSFPNHVCVSINEELLFGKPDDKYLNEGDLVSIDLTINYKGYFVDKAATFGLGALRFDQSYVLNAGLQCLNNAISICKPGIKTSHIGSVIYGTASYLKVKVVTDYGGHGIGLLPHSHPFIPNYNRKDDETKLFDGMTFTIEPIIVYQNNSIKNDGGVIIGDPISSHFEETVLITNNGSEVLTR